VFRLPGPLVLWWGWIVFVVVNLADLAIQGHDRTSLQIAIGLLAITGLVYACAFRPRVVADPDGLTLLNPIRDYRVPWGRVGEIYLGESVQVRCSPGTTASGKVLHSWALYSPRKSRLKADIRGRDVYRTIIFLSYPLMTVAVAIIWRWMFDERVGLINYAARAFDLVDKPIPFLNSFTWALPSVIAANIWQMLGFYMIILLTGLQNIPHELHEAAAIDGAGAVHRFRRITLPLLRPSIFLAFVIGMLNSITSFDLVYVMTGGGPGRATEILVTYIYKLGFVQTKFDDAAAVTVVFFVLLIVTTWTANRLAGGNVGAAETE